MVTRVIHLLENDPFRWVVEGMRKFGIGSIVIINEELQPVDILTEQDVIDALTEGLTDYSIREVLNILKGPERELITVQEDTPIEEVIKIFSQKGIKHLPVVDKKGRLVGIVSASDIINNLNKLLPLRKF